MARTILPSFAKGELSPQLHGRVDTSAYAVGLATAKNCIVHTYGGISRRPGTTWIAPVKDHSYAPRLIEFQFKTTDSYILEFGDQYMRVIRDDGHVLHDTTNITAINNDNPLRITSTAHGLLDGDEVFITGVVSTGTMATLLNNNRFTVTNASSTPNNFSIADQVTGVEISGVGIGTYTSGGTVAKVFEITTPYSISDVFDLNFTQSADVMTFVHKDYPIHELTRADHDDWSLTEIDFGADTAFPQSINATPASAAAVTEFYTVTAIDRETGLESLAGRGNPARTVTGATNADPIVITTSVSHGFANGDEVWFSGAVGGMTEIRLRRYIAQNVTSTTFQLFDHDGFTVDGTNYGVFTSGGVVRTTFFKLTTSADPPDNTITWTGVNGADRYAVYRRQNGIFGLIGETNQTTFHDDDIAPNVTITPPIYRNPFAVEGEYPGAVGYYEQRRVFGGSLDAPDTSEFSQTGDHYNFTRSTPIRDDDAITATLNAKQVNEIRHYVAQNDLLVFTSGSEWRIFAGPDNLFGPETIRQKPQTYFGCAMRPPIIVGNNVLFITEDEANVRSFGYSLEIDGYKGNNLNILSRHLLEGFFIIDWCYMRQPDIRIHMVRDDGKVLALAYDQEQEVLAWTWFETLGDFESCASLRGGGFFGEDSVYFVVKRTINGNTVRYIEVMRQTHFDNVDDCIFMDSALSYDGVPVDTVVGLEHLEGEAVVCLCDGTVVNGLTVTDASLTFAQEFSKIHVGLANVVDIETLNIEKTQGTIQGALKKVAKVVVRFFKSRGMSVGPNSSQLVPMKQASAEIFNGDEEILINPSWNTNGRIFIRQSDPLPITVLAIIPTLEVEDD